MGLTAAGGGGQQAGQRLWTERPHGGTWWSAVVLHGGPRAVLATGTCSWGLGPGCHSSGQWEGGEAGLCCPAVLGPAPCPGVDWPASCRAPAVLLGWGHWEFPLGREEPRCWRRCEQGPGFAGEDPAGLGERTAFACGLSLARDQQTEARGRMRTAHQHAARAPRGSGRATAWTSQMGRRPGREEGPGCQGRRGHGRGEPGAPAASRVSTCHGADLLPVSTAASQPTSRRPAPGLSSGAEKH